MQRQNLLQICKRVQNRKENNKCMKSILKKNEICYLSSMTRMMNVSQSQAPREAWWKFEENEGEDDDGNCDEDDDMMMMMMMMIDDDDDDG